jgi:predicted metal-dependent hydrolase
VARIPDDLQLAPAETLARGQDLLNRGLAFNAHEVFESAWKNCPDAERMLWQGLAQFAVGITHVQRGNRKGAAAVLRRAAGHLSNIAGQSMHDVDIAGLIDAATALADDLTAGRAITPTRLRPRLTR